MDCPDKISGDKKRFHSEEEEVSRAYNETTPDRDEEATCTVYFL